jgi:epsin
MATLGKPVSNPLGSGAAGKKSAGGDAFADLLGGSSAAKKAAQQTKGVSLADMQRQKASAGIWGSGSAAQTQQQQQQQTMGGAQQRLGGGLEDLLG